MFGTHRSFPILLMPFRLLYRELVDLKNLQGDVSGESTSIQEVVVTPLTLALVVPLPEPQTGAWSSQIHRKNLLSQG